MPNDQISYWMYNDTQHNAEHCYTQCRLCWVSLMLSVTYKPFMLSVIVLNANLLSVVAPYRGSACLLSQCVYYDHYDADKHNRRLFASDYLKRKFWESSFNKEKKIRSSPAVFLKFLNVVTRVGCLILKGIVLFLTMTS